MATDINLFDILVSPERSTADRLKALADLRPFLESEEGIAKSGNCYPRRSQQGSKTSL